MYAIAGPSSRNRPFRLSDPVPEYVDGTEPALRSSTEYRGTEVAQGVPHVQSVIDVIAIVLLSELTEAATRLYGVEELNCVPSSR